MNQNADMPKLTKNMLARFFLLLAFSFFSFINCLNLNVFCLCHNSSQTSNFSVITCIKQEKPS